LLKNKMMVKKTESVAAKEREAKELNKIDERAE
jgi:hypothetical protein